MDRVQAYEHELGSYLYDRLAAVPKVTIYGPPPRQAGPNMRASLATFNVEVGERGVCMGA